ncbi:MAG: 7-carboxy-7-deazaguanine synthase QueE [Planctomycetota bacterium]
MLISEIYCSRQGEGLLTGTPSVFVRTSGCNLRCGFCDTPFASWEPEGHQMGLQEIVEAIVSYREEAKHVVITGGEPMLPKQIVHLTEKLNELEFHITIETAGTIFHKLACDLISISPKLKNSDPDAQRAGPWLHRHRTNRHRPDVVRQLMNQYRYQLKFVVDSDQDLIEVEKYLAQIEPYSPNRVLLMPEGIELLQLERKEAWLRPACESRGFVFCPRMHIQWYGNKRGT